jgi:acetate---CoA ligase (ADP-forming)
VRDLTRLLRPRSIAVLGGGWAENVIEQCRKMGFSGPVWPVHPSKDSVGGLRAYPSIDALPDGPDATFIGVNRHATLDVVAQLAARGAGGAICFASGWAETGAGDLQAQLVARAGAMPVLGPNCYGVINYLDGALLWPDQHGARRVDRGVAIVSQSSNIAVNLTMQRRGLPVAYVACLGNAAQTGLADLAGALLADERVTALGLYVEGIADPAGFARMAQAARLAGRGIVAIKSGKTEGSARAAVSHTAALAGVGVASSAFLRQCGVAEVATLPELLEVLKFYHACGPLPGRRICAVCCSGGEAGLTADLAAKTALDFPAPDGQAAARLGAVLGPLVTISNPLDYHTFIWGDGPKTTEVFTAMLAGYDAGVFVIDPPRTDRCDPASFRPALDAIVAAARATGKPAIAAASIPENMEEAEADRLLAEGVIPMGGLEVALAALDAAATPVGRAGWAPWPVRAMGPTITLDEAAGKALLVGVGISVPRGAQAVTLEALIRLAGDLVPPLAIKGLGFAHKSEAGAVRLGLHALAGQAAMPGATGYLAEEMVAGGIAELLVGVQRDPVYGATLTLGIGGVTAELLADTVTLVPPVTADEVAEALRRLRLWPLLDGYRGRPKAAVGAAVQAICRMADLLAERDDLAGIEVNPLILTESRAVAVDALIEREAE